MPSYTVTVATGSQWFAGTDDYIYLSLVGSAGCSEKHLLDKPFYNDFERGAVDSYDVTVDEELGDIQLIKIEKRKYWFHDDWYLKYITVKTPCGDYIEFPCYRWLSGEGEIVLRDGQAKLACDDQIHILKQHRRKELETRQKQYRELPIDRRRPFISEKAMAPRSSTLAFSFCVAHDRVNEPSCSPTALLADMLEVFSPVQYVSSYILSPDFFNELL